MNAAESRGWLRWRWTPIRVFCLIAAVALVLPGAGVWWGTSLVETAVTRRATAGNVATAQAMAAQVSQAYNARLASAGNLLIFLTNGASFDGLPRDAERIASPFCRLQVLTASGSPLSTLPLGTCAAQPVPARALNGGAGKVNLPSTVINGVAIMSVLVRLNPAEVRTIDRRAAWLHVQFTAAGLISPVRVGRTGSYSLVDARTGLTLVAPDSASIGRPISSAVARRLRAAPNGGVLQTHAPQLRERVLTAYAPIPGAPLDVLISLPTAEAFADANHLRSALLVGFALLLALGLSAAALVAFLLARRDRKLGDQMDQLLLLASSDPLTGLANRTRLVGVLDAALSLVDRGTLPGLAVVYIDLDGVKRLNDHAGHDATDRLLVAIADALRATLRPADTVARFGGDEFVVLSPGVAEIAQAEQLAERICAIIRGTEVLDAYGTPNSLTASAGVTVTNVDQPPRSASELLRHADEAMYRIKHRGGDAAEPATATAMALPAECT